jgi:preprotein translocase subunit SecA
MEDELMRLFGGEQADNLMQRMKIAMKFPLNLASSAVSSNNLKPASKALILLSANTCSNTMTYSLPNVIKIYEQRNLIFDKETERKCNRNAAF